MIESSGFTPPKTAMESTFSVPPSPRRWRFAAMVLTLLVVTPMLLGLWRSFRTRYRQDRLEDTRLELATRVHSLAERFHRGKWMRQRSADLFRAVGGRPFSVGTARGLGRHFARRFPQAEVRAFGPDGRLVFSRPGGPQRTQEILWQGLVAINRQKFGRDATAGWLRQAAAHCRSRFGTLTTLSDLSGPDGLPQYYLDRGRSWFSWALPQETLTGSPTTDLGGVWILLDPQTLPADAIGRSVLKELPPPIDQACIVRFEGRRNIVEAMRGGGRPPPAVLRLLAKGRTEFDTPAGLWLARYIPNENGRYLLARAGNARLEGFWGRFEKPLGGAAALLLTGLVWLGWYGWWRGETLPLDLKQQVVGLFFLVIVLPLTIMITSGLERTREARRLERSRWEERLVNTLEAIDNSYLEYRRQRLRQLEEIEQDLAAGLPGASAPAAFIDARCSALRRFEILVMDHRGGQYRRNFDVASPQAEGQIFRQILTTLFVRMLDSEGQDVPPHFKRQKPLIQGESLERLINNLFRSRGEITRSRIGKRQILNRQGFLIGPDRRTQGLVSWIFDETEFARPFVSRVLASESLATMLPIRIGFVGDDGTNEPPFLAQQEELQDMVQRVGTFRSNEVAEIRLAGRPTLAAVISPLQLGSYQLVAYVDGDLLERDRRFNLQLLAVMLAGSLIGMIGCALFLSRHLVTQVARLRTFVGEISLGRYAARAEVSSGGELGQLAATFNQMAEKLQHRERMRQFVSEQVWDEIKKDDEISLALGGERREVAVLFSHLHDFDALTERLDADELVETLNAYFTRLDPVIRAQGGIIDKLIGDAVMAVFFILPGGEHPAVRAARAGAALLQEQARLNGDRRQNGREPLRTDVGLHFGPAISGKVGSRDGRIDFTVIGDTVNTAARICTTAAGLPLGSVLVSDAIRSRLPEGPSLPRLGAMALKGKQDTLDLFILLQDHVEGGPGQ